jgi:tetratricopeptide (TPR) repeat protein
LADLEVDDDLALDGSLDDALDVLDQELPLDEPSLDAPLVSPEELAAADELVGLEELDDIDLPPDEAGFDPDETSEADAETMGALHFSDGQGAIAERRWAEAITHFESAYAHGIDVAELHALLAWARFQASDESPTMADHALELLAYAGEIDPHLAMVHAYRSAVLLALGDSAGAQDAAQAALDIDPYDELAIDVMDKLV